MAKAGRPPVEDPRKHRVTVRMTESEYDMLEEYSKANSQTITDTMLEGFKLLLKKKKPKA